MFSCADLSDEHEQNLQYAEPLFQHFGGKAQFYGPIKTVKVFEDNVLVKKYLSESGDGHVLVVDGGASLRYALVGDRLASMAVENGWAGIVINGCIRDSLEIADIAIGIRALNTHPRRSIKKGEGSIDLPIRFAGIEFSPGMFLYADEDGIIVSPTQLLKR